MFGVARSLNFDRGGGRFDLVEFVDGQVDLGRSDVLLQALEPARSWDRDDPGLLARSQASAICAGVTPLRAAIVASSLTSAWFACRASGANRGMLVRMSELSNDVVSSIMPVRKPLPRGL
jgi:hypothetical protein